VAILHLSFITPRRQPVHIHIQPQKHTKKHTKLKNIQKLLKQYKTTFLNHKNRYEMRIEYKDKNLRVFPKSANKPVPEKYDDNTDDNTSAADTDANHYTHQSVVWMTYHMQTRQVVTVLTTRT